MALIKPCTISGSRLKNNVLAQILVNYLKPQMNTDKLSVVLIDLLQNYFIDVKKSQDFLREFDQPTVVPLWYASRLLCLESNLH